MISLLLAGCYNLGAEPGSDGDCVARIRYEGVLYRPHNELQPDLTRGRLLGTGDIVGCGGISAEAVDEVKVYAVKGVDPAVAVLTTAGEWGPGAYVAEGLPRRSWPPNLER